MSWTVARLGSRFNLLFEPYRRRVMHSALGRFLDQPLDLMVGFYEPDGTPRVLPLTTDGVPLANAEQFERFNSITFRGFSERYNLRFEFNVHSPFYPQDERLCIMPAFYLEMRVSPNPGGVRWQPAEGPTPPNVKLFIRLRRPETEIHAAASAGDAPARIDLAYRCALSPRGDGPGDHPAQPDPPGIEPRTVAVREQIVSLNPECDCLENDDGLCCELPVTEIGSGIKWRLVWAAHVADPVLTVRQDGVDRDARFRYCASWAGVEEVAREAITTRDERLAYSRRFEKLLEQAPIDMAERHLLHQGFQAWASNTFWCDTDQGDGTTRPWFSVWEGRCFFHSTIDVEYNASLFYLSLWPRLLRMQLEQWPETETAHVPSGGGFLGHDLGRGTAVAGTAYPHPMELEENSNYLLMMQAYAHWTGDKTLATEHADRIQRLADYLLWTDRDGSGFPSEGVSNTIDDASPAIQFARKQTYLAVKRLAGLRAAASLLTLADRADTARAYEQRADADLARIEAAAWLGDHYAVCVDPSAVGVLHPDTGQPLPYDTIPGWDAYSIYTANALLLPTLTGQPPLLDRDRVRKDITAGIREAFGRYGCGHTSSEPENIWVSQNIWRDLLAAYAKTPGLSAQSYWDMQVMSNTHEQSLGFVDTYVNNNLSFYPRGVTAMGYLLAGPRLVIDRLAPGGALVSVDPNRHTAQRWPLLPLADWKAGKIPVCVVDDRGRVVIECPTDPVVVRKPGADAPEASQAGVIG